MSCPAAFSRSALRATYSPPPRVAPQAVQSAAAGVACPCLTSGGRFCRTLKPASCGGGVAVPCPDRRGRVLPDAEHGFVWLGVGRPPDPDVSDARRIDDQAGQPGPER